MAEKGVKVGNISSQQIFNTLGKWHGLNTALKQMLLQQPSVNSSSNRALTRKVSDSVLWGRALSALSVRLNAEEKVDKNVSVEEASFYREGLVALKLAKEVIRVQHGWRANAVKDLNQSGGYSRTLANSATDWPCLLLELLSAAAEIDYFQVSKNNLILLFSKLLS